MRMAGYCSAMVLEPREPIVPKSNCTASLLQSPPVPSQPMALAYPALQLFYLFPGVQGSPPTLLPVLSSLPHRQPLFLPPLTCGPTQSRGEFFRPWENACSGTASPSTPLDKDAAVDCEQEASPSTPLDKDAAVDCEQEVVVFQLFYLYHLIQFRLHPDSIATIMQKEGGANMGTPANSL